MPSQMPDRNDPMRPTAAPTISGKTANIARTNATARPSPEVILLQAFEKNDTMPDHTRSHTCLRNLVIASQYLARRRRFTRKAMTDAMIRSMGFAFMATLQRSEGGEVGKDCVGKCSCGW